jgi:hypothetical protein
MKKQDAEKRPNGNRDEAKPPFFVLGSQRSGTTLLRLMLHTHPNLAIPFETGFMTAFARDASFVTPWHGRLSRYQDLRSGTEIESLLDDIVNFPFVRAGDLKIDKPLILSKNVDSFAGLIDAIMKEYARAHGKTRWGDKTPEYTEDIDLIWRLFPCCKFIHLVRDGRDVVLRQLKVPFDHWFSKSLPLLATRWARKTTICHKVGSVLGPEYYLELRFEDLIQNPEPVLMRITDFLGEPYSSQMLNYAEAPKSSVPQYPDDLENRNQIEAVHKHSFGALDRKMVNTWRTAMSKADRIIFEQNAGHALDLFHYEREHLASTLRSRVKNLYFNAWVRY